MLGRSGRQAALGLAALCALALAPAAYAQDFFAVLFGGPGDSQPEPYIRQPFATEGSPIISRRIQAPRPHPLSSSASSGPAASSGESQAYCVRSCDGRYFPLASSDSQSREASCKSFCPASETKVVYGSNIDNAATERGKAYSDLPNAFRYRKEMVAGCTCNGKDQIGLEPVKIEKDPTLRKGDIVAGSGGLMVAGRDADKRGASLNFSPASKSITSRYQHLPVVASE
jgi:hypothetical protein